MRRRQQHRLRPARSQRGHVNAIFIHGDRSQRQPGLAPDIAVCIAGILDREPLHPAPRQRPRDECLGLFEAAHDQNLARVGAHPAHAPEIVGQRLAQWPHTEALTVAEIVGHHGFER